jgi:hypothetical protein
MHLSRKLCTSLVMSDPPQPSPNPKLSLPDAHLKTEHTFCVNDTISSAFDFTPRV